MQQHGSKYFGPQTLGAKIQLFLNIVICISNLRESQMQHHCSKYFARRPHPHRRAPDPIGTKAQNSTFQEHGHVAYQTKGNHEFSNRIATILPTDQPPTRPLGWDQNSSFSEHGHVAYQIKGNHECSNMVATILPADSPHPTLWSKFNFFRAWSCCISD